LRTGHEMSLRLTGLMAEMRGLMSRLRLGVFHALFQVERDGVPL